MPRNAEVIRQWTILREIEGARGAGLTIDELSARCGVTTRTIRRDLQALEEAGFPLFDDRSGDDGRTRWCINGSAFKTVTTGLTLSELCALYFSRTLLESLAGTPFHADLERAFDKLTTGLTPHMQVFLDRLPQIIAAKTDPLRRRPGTGAQASATLIGRALEATLHSREAALTYHSKSSERTKVYRVHPYRLAYAQGGLYLLAHVPEYDEVRTFAMERVESLTLLETRFPPPEDPPERAFPHSLGVHSGPPERIEIAFTKDTADYVRSREWHPSQTISDLPGGDLLLTLDVCRDQALRSWILSFGASAEVRSPESLARETAEQLERARARYMVRLAP
jgi:predicted DNA-binding transcriptional regulator YafY